MTRRPRPHRAPGAAWLAAGCLGVLVAACGSPGTTTGTPPATPATTTTLPGATTAYVSQQLGGGAAVVDLATAGVAGTVPTGPAADPIAVTPDGRTVLVGNYGTATPGATVTEINAALGTVVRQVNVGGRPAAIAVTPNGRTAWVVDYQSARLVPFTVASGAVGRAIPLDGHPRSLALSPDGRTAYVGDFGVQVQGAMAFGDTVSRIDLTTGAITGSVRVGVEPCALAVSPSGRTLYVTVDGGATSGPGAPGTLVPVDTTTFRAEAPIKVGLGPAGLAVSANGRTVYVADSGPPAAEFGGLDPTGVAPGDVSVVDVAHRRVAATIPAGVDPWTIALTPHGPRGWVVDADSADVRPLDLAHNLAGTPIPVPGRPHGIVLTVAGPGAG